MSKKVHCDAGHIMKRDGDGWRCHKKLKNDKECNRTKGWSYVSKI